MEITQVVQGVQYQGSDEEIIYRITTTNWGSSPTSVSVTAFDETVKEVCTTTVFPTNSPSVNGDVITLSPLKALMKNRIYRIECKFTANGNVLECYFPVHCIG